MQLLYGTYNPAKLDWMRQVLAGLDIELIGLRDLPAPPDDAAETGETPPENARIKAIAYRDATGLTTLAADSALYLDGFADADQPGVHVRRQGAHRLSDEEMIAFYAAIAAQRGGRVSASYRNALCIAFADGRIVESFDEGFSSNPFYLADRPHPKRIIGFPLDSLSLEIASGQYYMDLPEKPTNALRNPAMRRFIAETMGISPCQ
ncbi:MAG: hypothetical protein LBN04_11175 [Oscillospiraceae bacterium]|jgi:8-oxo-dGTP diphosphatase|nr:hypothetical protein [Oscillospiraceae bacterium]